MSTTSILRAPVSTLDDDAWDDLLSFIEERRVIPIVGPELLQVATDRGPRLLYDWLAEKLAGRLSRSTPSQLPHRYTLNDVVCWFLAARGRREEAYVRLRSILKDAAIRAADGAAAVWRRSPTSTCSSPRRSTPLLEAAINLERFGGAPSTEVLRYAPNRVADLPSERDRLQRPVVYHLFGKLSASPTYVISDEDLLEFICALQNEHLAPEKLFHELEHNHLLFIGSNFTNWLARLFLRMAKRQRLSDPRDVGEVLADDHTGEDERLVAFLQQVSVRTRIYVGAERFVDELHRALAGAPQTGPVRAPPARAGALPAAGARDAGQRGIHQLRARGSGRGAADQGGAGGGRRHHLVRHGPARGRATTTIARSSATSRAARISSRWSRPPPSGGSRAISAASGAMRSTAARNMADGALFILPVIDRCHHARPRRWCRTSSRHCTSRSCPADTCQPEFAQRLTDFMQARHMNDVRQRSDSANAAAVDRAQPMAGPGLLHRGDARSISTAAKRKSPSSRGACSASC